MPSDWLRNLEGAGSKVRLEAIASDHAQFDQLEFLAGRVRSPPERLLTAEQKSHKVSASVLHLPEVSGTWIVVSNEPL